MIAFATVLLRLKNDFQRIFFKKEFLALAGKRLSNVWAMMAIAFLTFLALGFASGGLKKLERRMNDPFTNWVNIDNTSDKTAAQIPKIKEALSKDSIAKQYHLNSLSGYNRFWVEFYEKEHNAFKDGMIDHLVRMTGRTIAADDPLINKIFDPNGNNLVVAPEMPAETVFEENPCGIIVKEEMMQRLGYSNQDKLPMLLMLNNGNDRQFVFVPVLAVVRELPNLCQFICIPRFYNIMAAGGVPECARLLEPYADSTGNKCEYWGPEGVAPTLQQKAEAFFPGIQPDTDSHGLPSLNGMPLEAYTLSFPPAHKPKFEQIKAFTAAMQKEASLLPYSQLTCSENICSDNNEPNYLALHFNRLDKIRLLRNDLKKNFDVDVSMDQVESKENFALVSQLTFFISSVLLMFGIFSIVLFVNNLLKSHLVKIRPNIGTFAAFGLDDTYISAVYRKIVLAFLVLSVMAAFVVAALFGFIENRINGSEKIFDLFNMWVFGAIAGLFIFSLIVSGRTIETILGDTPGNLIYDR